MRIMNDQISMIRTQLGDTVGELTFTKVDGSTRVIERATTKASAVPAQPVKVLKEGENLKPAKAFNPAVLTFWSVDEGWRSCRVENIISWRTAACTVKIPQ